MREALRYAAIEWAVLPVKPGDKKPPMMTEWERRASSDRSTVLDLCRNYPRANPAVHVGKSGLAVIDMDPRNGGNETLAALEAEHGPLWATDCLEATTPSGGKHFVFKAPQGVELPGTLGAGVDLLHGNRYFMVAPSFRADGAYQWAPGQGPFDAGALDGMPVLPSWCHGLQTDAIADSGEAVDPLAQLEHKGAPDTPEERARFHAARLLIDPDCGNDEYFQVSCAHPATGWHDWRELLDEWASGRLRGVPAAKYDERAHYRRTKKLTQDGGIDLGTLYKIAARYGFDTSRAVMTDPERPDGGREDCTDAGNVNVLVRLANGNLRRIRETKEWMVWSPRGKWERGHQAEGIARDLVLQVAEEWLIRAKDMEAQGDDAPSKSDRERLTKVADAYRAHSKACRGKKLIEAMLSLASNDPRIAISAAVLDLDAHVIGCQNGVVDLRTGQLQPNARERFITKHVPYAYDPDAKAPTFERFVDEVTGIPDGKGYTPRPELRNHVQRFLGMALSATVVEQVMGVALGNGGNGKNQLLDAVMHAMGPYAVALPPEALLSTSKPTDGDRATPTLASLQGVRLALTSETKDGARLDVAVVKRHTGGGFVTARPNYGAPITFELTHKLILMTNVMPTIEHMDDAMRGRLQIIPFDRAWNRPGHPDPDPSLPDGDRNLGAALRAESPGILAWLVRGAVAYYREGLRPPEVVAAKTRIYLAEQGHVAQWIEGYARVPWKEGTRASELFEGYMDWCKTSGIGKPSPGTSPKFRDALQALKIDMGRDSGGSRYGLSKIAWADSM